MIFSRKKQTSGRQRKITPSVTPPKPAENYPPQARRTSKIANVQPPKQTKPHFIRYWLNRIGVLLLIIALGASLINILSLKNTAIIKPSSETKELLNDTSAYQQTANKLLSASIFNKNKLTIDSKSISNEMLKQYPELASVDVELPLLAHNPIFHIQPAQPALVLSASNGSYVISNNGKILATTAKSSSLKALNLPVVGDSSGLQAEIGEQALPSKNVSFIVDAKKILEAKGIRVGTITLPSGTSEVDMAIVGQPYVIKFNLHSNNPAGQAGTALVAINELKKSNTTPGKYIDVRVDGRAYFQ